MDSDECCGALQIEDTPRDCLEFRNKLVELVRFSVELGDSGSEAPQISDAIRVLLQDEGNGVERMAGWGVELGGFDQMGGNL